MSPNDIAVLGYTAKLLRKFDAYYRYASREKTNSMLESIEIMYMTHLNFIGKSNTGNPNNIWFDKISEHFSKALYPNRIKLYDNDIVKLRQITARLFTIYDLTTEFKNAFDDRLVEECAKYSISYEAFLAFRKDYGDELLAFKKQVYSDNYKNIRENKKLHFWMNSGTIKISTINSFKGWESEFVFLILEPKYERNTQFNMSFDELLYTGLTRCRRNLVVINFGNKEYDEKIRPLINSIK